MSQGSASEDGSSGAIGDATAAAIAGAGQSQGGAGASAGKGSANPNAGSGGGGGGACVKDANAEQLKIIREETGRLDGAARVAQKYLKPLLSRGHQLDSARLNLASVARSISSQSSTYRAHAPAVANSLAALEAERRRLLVTPLEQVRDRFVGTYPCMSKLVEKANGEQDRKVAAECHAKANEALASWARMAGALANQRSRDKALFETHERALAKLLSEPAKVAWAYASILRLRKQKASLDAAYARFDFAIWRYLSSSAGGEFRNAHTAVPDARLKINNALAKLNRLNDARTKETRVLLGGMGTTMYQDQNAWATVVNPWAGESRNLALNTGGAMGVSAASQVENSFKKLGANFCSY
jgi:hypothetical protein